MSYFEASRDGSTSSRSPLQAVQAQLPPLVRQLHLSPAAAPPKPSSLVTRLVMLLFNLTAQRKGTPGVTHVPHVFRPRFKEL